MFDPKSWIGRTFRCDTTGVTVTITKELAKPRKFIPVGQGFVELGDGAYVSWGGLISEVLEQQMDDEVEKDKKVFYMWRGFVCGCLLLLCTLIGYELGKQSTTDENMCEMRQLTLIAPTSDVSFEQLAATIVEMARSLKDQKGEQK